MLCYLSCRPALAVLWLLLGLSIAVLAVVIERAVLFLSSRDDAGRLRFELRRLLRDNDLELARRRLQESPSFEARVAAAGLDADDAASAFDRMQGESELCRLSMERNLTLLGTLGSKAPLLGLLGALFGLAQALRSPPSASSQLWAGLLAPFAEALVTAAMGLAVALPAALAFKLFQSVIRARMAHAAALTHEVLGFLKSASQAGAP